MQPVSAVLTESQATPLKGGTGDPYYPLIRFLLGCLISEHVLNASYSLDNSHHYIRPHGPS